MENENNEPSEAKVLTSTWLLASHLTGLTNIIGIPGFIGPLVIWLLKKEESEKVGCAAKESLNFQITLLIAGLICSLLVFIVIGIFGLIALAIVAIVFPILATVKTSNGETYQYPMTFRFIK